MLSDIRILVTNDDGIDSIGLSRKIKSFDQSYFSGSTK